MNTESLNDILTRQNEYHFLNCVDGLLCEIAKKLLENKPVKAYCELMLLRESISNRMQVVK
jgi:hypothetical protein